MNHARKHLLKMGSMHLEYFFILVWRCCIDCNHLISVAHSIERIYTLRIVQKTAEMKWFNEIKRIQLKKPMCNKILNGICQWQV